MALLGKPQTLIHKQHFWRGWRRSITYASIAHIWMANRLAFGRRLRQISISR